MSEAAAPSREEPRHERGLVLRGLGWSALGYPLNVGFGFLAQVLAARLLTKAGFGTWSLAFSIFTIGGLVAALGLPSSLLRRASAAIARGDLTEARHEIASSLLFGALAAVVIGILIGSPLGEEVLGEAFPETAVATVAVLLGARTALRVLENVVPEAIRAFRDYFRVMLFDGLLANAAFVGALVVLLVVEKDTTVRTVMLVSVIVTAAALVPAFGAVVSKLHATRGTRVQWRNTVEPSMWASTIGRAVIAQLDLLVVGALGTSREVALYAAPFRVALLVGFPLIAVNQVVTPLIAGWYAQGRIDRLERTLRGTAGLAVLGASVGALILVVAGEPLLRGLFGPSYGEGWAVLAILAVGQVLQTWAGSCGFALMMTGHQRWYAWLLLVSTVLTLVADVVFFELMGIEGVALATTAMLVLQNVAQVVYLRTRAGFTTVADLRAVVGEVRTLRSGGPDR